MMDITRLNVKEDFNNNYIHDSVKLTVKLLGWLKNFSVKSFHGNNIVSKVG